MFSEETPTPILESKPAAQSYVDDNDEPKFKKKYIIIFLVVVFVAIGLGGFFYMKNIKDKKILAEQIKKSSEQVNGVASSTPVLPESISVNATSTNISFSDIAIEYLSFYDFYKSPELNFQPNFKDYKLPLNIKIDVSNYYALSRKLNLDPGLEGLSSNGFAIINNPWAKEAPDFYSIYNLLEEKQIPILVSSDFTLYYYQSVLKKVYKDIEENIFYSNLWSINKDLYESAKKRYEARLALIGDINDTILEGERLETAFFAVSLELLKPAVNQIAKKGSPSTSDKFSYLDSNRYYFVTPPYLRDDVARELALIREGKQNIKSPVMLYEKNYRDFIVPREYAGNVKLNNFYLAKKWLNSVFPLNYKDKNCPKCLLDKEDWRLTMIAASFISVDFSDSLELKNKWARIYKLMSFFDPLRDDLNYVFYRDALKSVFGEKYNIEQLFDDKNPEAKNNLVKFQKKLNELTFSPFLGAIDKNDPSVSQLRGFKMLVDNYSPNNYIFSKLVYPQVGTYVGTSTSKENVTACEVKKKINRCNPIALDVINLVSPVTYSSYFSENTNYLNYDVAINKLKTDLQEDSVWRNANYWSNLAIVRDALNSPNDKFPIFTKSMAWKEKNINTAVSAWINLQVPVDNFKFNESNVVNSLNDFAKYRDDSYIEPDLTLINELLANQAMITKMLEALQIDKEIPNIKISLNTLASDLGALKALIIKQLEGKGLEPEDNEFISSLINRLKIDDYDASQKRIVLKIPGVERNLNEELGDLKLMVLIRQDGESKLISVGPVWNYSEKR